MDDMFKKCDPSCECMGRGHERRREDRRSCHATSFVLGLAVAARDVELVIASFDRMFRLLTPSGHAPN